MTDSLSLAVERALWTVIHCVRDHHPDTCTACQLNIAELRAAVLAVLAVLADQAATVRAETERCAKIAEGHSEAELNTNIYVAGRIAAAIRAGGTP